MGDLAERNVKQKERGHEKEDPHPPCFGPTLPPEFQCHETDAEKNRHQENGEEIVRTAYDSDLRDRESPINTSNSNEEGETHEDHENRRNSGSHDARSERNYESGTNRQRHGNVEHKEFRIKIEILTSTFHIPRS